jgi:hypothetical protein
LSTGDAVRIGPQHLRNGEESAHGLLQDCYACPVAIVLRFTDGSAMKAVLIRALTRTGSDHGSTEEATSRPEGKIKRAR